MGPLDLAAFLIPDGEGDDRREVRCAWRRMGGWQITVTAAWTVRGGVWRRLVKTYDVAPDGGRAALVGEIGHVIDGEVIVEDRRMMGRSGAEAGAGRGKAANVRAIEIPRRMRAGDKVSVAGGVAVIELASVGRAKIGGLSRRAAVLAAIEAGARGEIELLEGIGEIRIAGPDGERRVAYVESAARPAAAGKRPAWWRTVRLSAAKLEPGAPGVVL